MTSEGELSKTQGVVATTVEVGDQQESSTNPSTTQTSAEAPAATSVNKEETTENTSAQEPAPSQAAVTEASSTGDTAKTAQESPTSITDNAEESAAASVTLPEKKTRGRKKGSKVNKPSATVSKTDNEKSGEQEDTQPLFEQPVILEGKRSRKPTSRLELSELVAPKKDVSLPVGKGTALADIPYVSFQITHASLDNLGRLRAIIFGRRVTKANTRQSIRNFSGFEFERDSVDFQRVLGNLNKLKKDQLKKISDILGVSDKGTKVEHADRILDFLMKPKDEGQPVPEKKTATRQSSLKTGRKSRTSKESGDTEEDDQEDEEGKEDEEGNKAVGDDSAPMDEATANGEDDNVMDTNEEEHGSDDDDYGEEIEATGDPDDEGYVPGKKESKKKPAAGKRRQASTQKRKRGASPTTKATHASKKAKTSSTPSAATRSSSRNKIEKTISAANREKESEEVGEKPQTTAAAEVSEDEAKNEEQVEKKGEEMVVDKEKAPSLERATKDETTNATAALTTATENGGNHSKEPNDDELRNAVSKIVKEGDKSEATMQNVVKDVMNAYPKIDLSQRKSFIEDLVKEMLSMSTS